MKKPHLNEWEQRVLKLLLTCLGRVVSAVRLAAGALLFTPLLALIVYVNPGRAGASGEGFYAGTGEGNAPGYL